MEGSPPGRASCFENLCFPLLKRVCVGSRLPATLLFGCVRLLLENRHGFHCRRRGGRSPHRARPGRGLAGKVKGVWMAVWTARTAKGAALAGPEFADFRKNAGSTRAKNKSARRPPAGGGVQRGSLAGSPPPSEEIARMLPPAAEDQPAEARAAGRGKRLFMKGASTGGLSCFPDAVQHPIMLLSRGPGQPGLKNRQWNPWIKQRIAWRLRCIRGTAGRRRRFSKELRRISKAHHRSRDS